MTGAPQQKDFFTKRWRQVRRPDPKESQIQISLVAHLKLRCRKDVVYFHVPNGEERGNSAGAKLKAMGVLRGVADLLFFWCDDRKLKVLFLELKRRSMKPSLEQLAFAQAVRECGAAYEAADGIDAAIEILRRYGLLKQ